MISFVLGVLSIAIAVAVAASVMSNGVSTPLANAAGWAVLLMMVIGLILGIVGARIRRGRAWAILGLILNGGYLLLTIIGLLGGVGSSGL